MNIYTSVTQRPSLYETILYSMSVVTACNMLFTAPRLNRKENEISIRQAQVNVAKAGALKLLTTTITIEK